MRKAIILILLIVISTTAGLEITCKSFVGQCMNLQETPSGADYKAAAAGWS